MKAKHTTIRLRLGDGVNQSTISSVMRVVGRLGGLARAAKLTPEQRLASSRKANAAKAKKKGR